MTTITETRRGSDFAVLCREVRAARLLERRRGNYAVRVALTLAALAGSWWAFVVVGNSWYQTIVALLMGLVFTQVAFIGHDAGHQQVARTRRVKDPHVCRLRGGTALACRRSAGQR